MNKKLRIVFLGLVLFCIPISQTHAALIGVVDHDDYFTDTQSGLDWLDVTQSANISFTQMQSNLLDEQSEFYGWRYASIKEFGQMVDNTTGLKTGITGGYQMYLKEGEEFGDLIALFGSTLDLYALQTFGHDIETENGWAADSVEQTRGMLNNFNTGAQDAVFIGDLYNYDHSSSIDRVNTNNVNGIDHASYQTGSYLIRTSQASIPTPAPLLLILAGLLILLLPGINTKKN